VTGETARRLGFVALASTLALTAPGAGAADGDGFAVGPPQWQLAAGAQHSTWDEYAPGGKALLHERGWLSGASGGVRVAFRRGDVRLGALGLELGHWQGTRDYDGTTSLGTPAQTVVDVRRTTLALRGEAALASAWSATAQLQPNWLHRNLRDTANAQGYPEDWRWTLARIGLQWRSASGQAADEVGDESGLSGHAAWGRVLAPRVELRLPGRDAATLEPGTGTAWQAGARWGATLGAYDAQSLARRYEVPLQRVPRAVEIHRALALVRRRRRAGFDREFRAQRGEQRRRRVAREILHHAVIRQDLRLLLGKRDAEDPCVLAVRR